MSSILIATIFLLLANLSAGQNMATTMSPNLTTMSPARVDNSTMTTFSARPQTVTYGTTMLSTTARSTISTTAMSTTRSPRIDGVIIYTSIDQWQESFSSKFQEQESKLSKMKRQDNNQDSYQDVQKRRFTNYAENQMRTISHFQDYNKRWLLGSRDQAAASALRAQESRFCNFGYNFWPLITDTARCGAGFAMGNCCTINN